MLNFLSQLGIGVLYFVGGFVVGAIMGYVFKGSIKKEIADLLDEASNAIDDTNKELKQKLEDAKKNL